MVVLNDRAGYIIDNLQKNGFQAYIVGGALRDMLMNRIADDIDITTDASPEEVEAVFSNHKVIETGIKHGTVTVLIDDIPIEITTFRIEDTYTDGRHPDKVLFSKSIEDDLRRRDFTMNSIAYNLTQGFVDPFGGRKDIENRIIRCVGNPTERFTEDSLRILRAMRFASVLSFEIDDKTEKAMFECKGLLKNISKERIYAETVKMLCGKNIRQVLIKYTDIIAEYIPEISYMKNFNQHNFHHKYDLLTHTAVVVENTDPVPHLRLSALLHDIAKPVCLSFDNEDTGHFYKHSSVGADMANTILLKLHSDNNTIEKVVKLIKWHDTPIEESERIIKKKLRIMGEELLSNLIKLQRADTKGLADEFQNRSMHFDKLEQIITTVISEQQCFSLKDLAINGNDVSELGYKGKEIGIILNSVLDAVIETELSNNKAEIIDYIKRNR